MRTKRTITFPLALLAWLSISVATAQTAYVAGPVERLSVDFAEVTVLGQTYVLDAETIFAANGRRISSLSGMRALQSGGLIAIESGPPPQLRRASLVVVSTAQYVAGATPLFVGGIVDQVVVEYGTLKIGGLHVDVSATPPDVLATIAVGSFVEVSGTQPSPQGMLLGKDIVVSASPSAQSISGTGSSVSAQSISGTGSSVSAQSISGTGSSVSAQSISGTGSSVSTQSISGTGSSVSTQSISGTGRSSSLQSISGTGSTAL